MDGAGSRFSACRASFRSVSLFGEQRVDDRVHIDPGKAQRRDAARAVIARQGAACRAPTPLRLSVASPQSCMTAIISAGASA
jgi:hypothetical protein